MVGSLKLGLIFTLTDRVSAPIRGIGRLVGGLHRPFQVVGLAVGGLVRDLRNVAMAGAAVGAALGAGLFRMVRSTADAGDEAVKTAQKVGVGVEAWQRFAYAARLADVESGQLADGLKFLNQSAVAAATGAGLDSRAFRALGVSVRDSRGQLKSTSDLFLEVAEAMSKMPDGAVKGQAAMAIFGRAGTEMIPLLNAGRDEIRRLGEDADRLGIVIPEEQAKAAERFNDSLTTLFESFRGLKIGISAGLLPQMTALVERTTAYIAANKPAIIARVKVLFGQISAALPGIIKGLQDFAKFLGQIAAVMTPLIAMIGGFTGVLDVLAVVMVTRVAIAIWSAVSAVMGLNVAMLANPIGLVIAAVAALILVVVLMVKNWGQFSAFFGRMWARTKAATASAIGFLSRLFLNFSPVGLIIKHWASIVGFFSGLWDGIKSAFKVGVEAVWNVLPPWFRQVLRGATFVVRAVSGIGGQPSEPEPASDRTRPASDAARPATRPQLAVGQWALRQQQNTFSGQFDFRHFYDGRPPVVTERGLSPGLSVANTGAVTTRGG